MNAQQAWAADIRRARGYWRGRPEVAGLSPSVFYEKEAARGSMSDHSSRLNCVTAGAFAVFHAGALAVLFFFTWRAFWVALVLLWITGGWGIGMGYHRLLTHRGYETPRWLECILTICGALGRNPSYPSSKRRQERVIPTRLATAGGGRMSVCWCEAT
jgi:hypothetical protein